MAVPMSTTSGFSMTGTGINPWWRYQEENVPGGGHVMVNVGTGNLLLQEDDMNVPHKGIALAFRRTYNSQSGHDVNGSDGTPAGNYGNGWTNTWDAHFSSVSAAQKSVYDVDGARYDYTAPAVAGGSWTPVTAGQHASLVYDGSCGWLWTKKSGTTYYFYTTTPTASCASMPTIGATVGGLAGRLYQIIGRNTNTHITFSYYTPGTAAMQSGGTAQMTATTESGMTATVNFSLISGYYLMTSLVRPDGRTISYGYDAAGDLTRVTLPPNNGTAPNYSDGVSPVETYGYTPLGSRQVLQWAASPRWSAAPGTCSADMTTGCGGYLQFAYTGTAPSLSEIDHVAYIDPTPPDGTNTPLQPAPGNGAGSAAAAYLSEYYALGQLGSAATPTFRDTDGHATNWVTDASGRPTQSQECTAAQNQQCTGTWLTSGQTWDTANEMTAQIDARGYETDYRIRRQR